MTTRIKGAGFSPYLHTEVTEYNEWLPDFKYRIPITLTGGVSGVLSNYQILISKIYDNNMQENFNDVRFTESDGKTLINSWLESKTDAVNANIYVKFPTTPTNLETKKYYMYFGNSGVSNNWDGDNTFEFFDDFSGDLSQWTTIGTPTISNNILTLNQNDGIYNGSYDVDGGFIMCGSVKISVCDDNAQFGFKTLSDRFNNYSTLDAKAILNAWCNTGVSNLRCVLADGTTNAGMPILKSPISSDYNNWKIALIPGVSATSYYNSTTLDHTTAIPVVSDNLHPTIFNFNDADDSDMLINNVYICKCVTDPPTYEFGNVEYY